MTLILVSAIFLIFKPFQFTLSFIVICILIILFTWKLYVSEDNMEKTYKELNILSRAIKKDILKSPSYKLVVERLNSYMLTYLADESERNSLIINQALKQLSNNKALKSGEFVSFDQDIDFLKSFSSEDNIYKELHILLFLKYTEWLINKDEFFDEKFKSYIDSLKIKPDSQSNLIEN
jgi:hypothetical protein